jgi:hypothetical protein
MAAVKESTPMGLTSGSRHTALITRVSLAIVLVTAMVACSGEAPTPSPSPTAAPTAAPAASAPQAATLPPAGSPDVTGAHVCADLAAFQAGLDGLTGLDLESVRIREVIDAAGTVVTTGLAFVESAKAAFGPEAQALGDALAGLQTALQGVTEDGSLGDKAASIENAIDEVAAAFDALKAELSPGCPAPAASAS